MSIDKVRVYLEKWGRGGDIRIMKTSTATVALAAEALGIEGARIAKTISLRDGDEAMVIVMAGDARLQNRKFRDRFGFKPKMLTAEEALELTGHAVGGVCPFALPKAVKIYLDESLKRFETVFPACGSADSAIELTVDELSEYTGCPEWVDTCTI